MCVKHRIDKKSSKFYAVKKSEEHEALSKLLSLHMSVVLQFLWKKKKDLSKGNLLYSGIERPRYPNNKNHEVQWQYINKRTQQQKALELQY